MLMDEHNSVQDTRLVLKRHFKAPPTRLWQAWTDAQQLSRWFGPDPMRQANVSADVRVGGGFSIVMESGDGEQHCVGGTYLEVKPPHRLVFTWAWQSTPQRQSLVTVELSAADGGTLLALTHEQLADRAASDSHASGWQSSLVKLAELVR